MPFDEVRSPHRYALQLPQHDPEILLEEAALGTGLVEIRRGHRVAEIGQSPDRTNMEVEGPDESYRLEAPWAVGCDGARSGVQRMLGIVTKWRDYGTDSAVADFAMDCDLPKEVSWIVLHPACPYGFFYFALRRWRFIYRLNKGEDRQAIVTEAAATELLRLRLPNAHVHRFFVGERFPAGAGTERHLSQ